MKYQLVDRVIEQSPTHIVAVKQVTLAEEYLADHFPSFPVLPGVMMVETLVQAARMMLADRGDGRLVLGEARAIKFASMVRPGQQLFVEVSLVKETEDGQYSCKGIGRVQSASVAGDGGAGGAAVSGRFTMRPMRRG